MTAAAAQALMVGERLLDPCAVTEVVPARLAGSLAHGLAGTALLHARLSSVDPVFAQGAAEHWSQAAAHTKSAGEHGAGVYHSPGGLAASLIIGTAYLPDPDAHHEATARAARWMSMRAVALAEQHRRFRAGGGTGTPWHVYDAITGLAGIGRVLVAALQSGHDCEPGLLAALETLTTMIGTRHSKRPGWWLAADRHPEAVQVATSGAATTGIAHGIAGPLALLSTAELAGYSISGQRAAIRDAADWLLQWCSGNTWPPHVSGTELDTDAPAVAVGRRDAWCYGSPGISRALTLAGQAIGNPTLTQAASTAVAALAARPSHRWDVDNPTLCHGYAGVLQATALREAAAAVTTQFDRSHRFGFQHVGGTGTGEQPGFLVGAAGVALTLADHNGLAARDVPARWDALLLLS